MFWECLELTLRVKDNFSDLSNRISWVSETEPISERSAKGYNPVLDWRIEW